ncbi:MAG: glycosyl transferase [Acidobacteria bacterium]|nr:glycosyl transferase [Acidobacteriota bacterium]
MSAGTEVVLIAGRDPLDEVSGGHSSYVRSHARAALLAGFTPHLFCVAPDSSVTETELGILHRVRSPYRPFRQMVAGAHARPLAAALVRFARDRQGPLLIHSFGVWGIAAIRAAPPLRTLGIEPRLLQSSYTTYRDEALSHVRGAVGYPWYQRLRFAALSWWVAAVVERWEHRAYLGAGELLVNYESVAALVRKRHGAEARCRTIPYAAESAFFDEPPPARTNDLPLMVSIARHEPRKGVDVLLRALARVKSEGIPFRAQLIGGGPLLAEHRRLAASLGLHDRVTIEGVVPDVGPALRAADLFVLPSREEQSGSLALLEALQAGAAIIATAVDGLLEDLTPEHDAITALPGDPSALAAALARVLTDEALRQRLQWQARMTFEQRFAAAPFAAALGTLYGQLLGRAAELPGPLPQDHKRVEAGV